MNTRIGFSTPNWFNPVSWLVRKLTKSRASHAWFVYYDLDWKRDMVLEAHELGFRLLPYSKFKKANKVVGVFKTKESLDEATNWVCDHLGEPYDFGGLIGMAFVLIGRFFKRKWKNPLQNSKAMFCSEMVVSVLQMVRFPATRHIDPHSTSPEDLLLLLESESKNGTEVQACSAGED